MNVIVRSMTGFGRGKAQENELSVDVEIKTVNHRFLDIVFRMPQCYAVFESEMRPIIAKAIERGKVEVLVARQKHGKEGLNLELNRPLFDAYFDLYADYLSQYGCNSLEATASVILEILSKKEVIFRPEDSCDEQAERTPLLQALSAAVREVREMREVEGRRLGLDVARRLLVFTELRKRIAELVKGSEGKQRELLLGKVKKLAADTQIEESRLIQEVALISERLDVSEELTRLESHIDQFHVLLASPPNGRKLDFLIQEMGREVNTISSKCQNAELQIAVVDAKAELEKIREQVQNFE